MREIRTSGLMSGEGKRACATGTRTAPLLDSTGAWPQAPRSDGYNWPVAGRSRPPRQRTGPRRRRGSAPRGPTELPVHRAHHRRRRLSRAKDESRRRPPRQLGASDRAPLRPAPVRRAAEKMDRGAHLGLDQPLSSAGTRLRASRSQGGRVRPSRNDPSHAPAPRLNVLIRNRNFPEGLLDQRGPSSSLQAPENESAARRFGNPAYGSMTSRRSGVLGSWSQS